MSDDKKEWAPQYISGPNEMSDAAMAYFRTGDVGQQKVLSYLKQIAPYESVVDFGTGRGTWLLAAMGLGVSDIRGYDIPGTPVEELRIPPTHFIEADLGAPVDAGRSFDLAVSTEVAEHIEPERAAQFIANLAAASNLVLFSAAIPYQGGVGHQNELWVEYWAKRFLKHGFRCHDILRPKFWHDGGIRSYYRQNLLIFAKGEQSEKLSTQGFFETEQPLSLIHPEQYLKAVGRPLPPESKRVGPDVTQYYDCVTKHPDEIDADQSRHIYGKDRIGWGAILDHFGTKK